MGESVAIFRWVCAQSSCSRSGRLVSAARFAQAQVKSGQLERPAGTSGPAASAVDLKAPDSKPPGRSDNGAVDSPGDDGQEGSRPVQSPTPEPDHDKTQKAESDRRKGEWVIAPIPVNSPALGAGLQWAVGYVFPLSGQDKISPPSIAGIAGLFTSNGSRAIGMAGKLYFGEDKYRVTLAGGNASINADLYGVGKLAGDRGLFLRLTAKGTGMFVESLFQVRKGVYLGGRFQYRNLRLSIDRKNANPPADIEINPPPEIADIVDAIREDLFRQQTVAIAPRFQFDSRNNTFYPTRGVFVDAGIDLFTKALRSKFTYQYYKAAFNKYTSLSEHQVLAFRAMGCAAAGSRVPVYDLCLFGFQNDVRGYAAGRYQDRRMFATQVEYRLAIPKTGFLGRFGAVAFGGVGGVGRKFTDISVSEMLPGGGGGIRFRLTKKNPINFRIDYGIGKAGGTLIIGVGEAF